MSIEQWGFIVGLLAAVLSTVSFLPQVIQVFKTKRTKDLSLATFVIFCIAIIMWLIYGILVREIPVIVANSMVLILAFSILVMKIKYG